MKRKGTSHPFDFSAAWLEKVAGTDPDLLFAGELLRQLSKVVRPDGSFNGFSRYAEKVAIRLIENKRYEEGFELFMTIVDIKRNNRILLVHGKPVLDAYVSEETADTHGQLGYKGVLRFGQAAMRHEEHWLAKKLFLELVERIPTICFPVSLSDARLKALEHLTTLGMKTLSSGVSIMKELETARYHNG